MDSDKTASARSNSSKRREDLRMLEDKARPSRQVLVDTEQEFRAYHRLGQQQTSALDISTNEDLAVLLQEQRRQYAMPPLPDAAALVARCPEVFRALARGEPLEPLVASGHLVTTSTSETADERDTEHRTACFYIREWLPTDEKKVRAALEKFAADYPTQAPFVKAANARASQAVQYVGMYRDEA
jgi:hypothetical protein